MRSLGVFASGGDTHGLIVLIEVLGGGCGVAPLLHVHLYTLIACIIEVVRVVVPVVLASNLPRYS